MEKSTNRVATILAPIVMFFVLFGGWEVLTIWLKIPAWVLPAPTAIIKTMFMDFKMFWPHILVTVRTIAIGFCIAVPLGVLLATILTANKTIDSAVSPLVTFLVVTPLYSLVPLLMLFLGYGMNVKIIAVVLQSFPIVNMNCCTGFNNVEPMRLELMQSIGAKRLKTFGKVIFPSSLTNFFTGVRLSAIFAVTSAVGTEYVGGNSGLGSQIIKHSQFMNTEGAFACIFYVAIIGIILYTLVGVVEKKVITWKV